MARYYFHLHDGIDVVLDEEGRELSDLAAAIDAAFADARSIISHDALEGRINLDQWLDIETAGGEVIHRLPFVDAVEVIRPTA